MVRNGKVHMSSITTRDGLSINYTRSGTGPALILIHGITEDLHAWDEIAAILSSDYDVIQVDLRGHGMSDPADNYSIESLGADVAELATQLDLDRPHLIGHSLGGMVVSAVAGVIDVASVVNIDQVLRLDAFQDLLLGAEELLRSEAFTPVMESMFADMAGPTTPAQVIENTKAYAASAKQDVVLGVWEPVFTLTNAELVDLVVDLTDSISAPYLAIHGTDPGDEYRDWLSGAVKTADLEVWEGGGHWPHRAEQDRFVARVREFHSQR